jgi:hypothetical protein
MNFQMIFNSLEITILVELIVTSVIVIAHCISSDAHMDTVSWNG